MWNNKEPSPNAEHSLKKIGGTAAFTRLSFEPHIKPPVSHVQNTPVVFTMFSKGLDGVGSFSKHLVSRSKDGET